MRFIFLLCLGFHAALVCTSPAQAADKGFFRPFSGCGEFLAGELPSRKEPDAVAKPIPFHEKFQRQNEGKLGPAFDPGETIEGSFLVGQVRLERGNIIDETKLKLLFDDGRLDVRHADLFYIAVDPAQYASYLPFLGNRFKAVLRIKAPVLADAVVSNTYKYDAELVGALVDASVLNPTPAMVSQLAKGADVKVEGTVLSISGNAAEIQSSGGQVLSVQLIHGIPKYEGSADPFYENFKGKLIEPGDRVRVLGFADEGEILASSARTAILLQPNAARREKYNSLRERVQALLDELLNALRKEDYALLRSKSAHLMKSELTVAERRRLEALMAGAPENERPLLLWDRYLVESLNRGYQVDLDEMTLSAFKQYVTALSQGVLRQPSIEGVQYTDESSFYRLLEDLKLPEEFQVEIFTQTIRTHLKFFEDLSAKGEGPSHDGKRDRHSTYTMKQALVYLSLECHTPEAVRGLIGILDKYAALEASGWTFAGNFRSFFRDALENAYADAKKSSDPSLLELFKRAPLRLE